MCIGFRCKPCRCHDATTRALPSALFSLVHPVTGDRTVFADATSFHRVVISEQYKAKVIQVNRKFHAQICEFQECVESVNHRTEREWKTILWIGVVVFQFRSYSAYNVYDA